MRIFTNWRRCFLAKSLLLLLLLTFVLISGAMAEDQVEGNALSINGKHQAGIRIGAWANQGETHPEFWVDVDSVVLVETSINSGSVYFEAYYSHYLTTGFFLQVSAGIVNRGSVSIHEFGGSSDIGNLTVYPFLVQAKYYPLSTTGSRMQPFVTAGGGLYYGRRSVQFTTNYYSYLGWNDDTATDFNYVFGGGFDWMLNKKLALEANVSYMPIDFSKGLVAVSDYSAATFTVGVKYMYSGKK